MASSKAESSLTVGNSNSGRLPQAPASLLVQLPPDELKKLQTATINGSIPVHLEGAASRVQASDLHLLATSIQERREREARVFTWQQRLIDADEHLGRADLKRALTQLSLSTWLQVLQERHLDDRCAYPTCSRKPKQRHLSARQTILPLDAPRYRISLANRTIKRDERDDAGGENGYCSKACWRRGEWISRWVLEGNVTTRREKEKKSIKKDQEFGSAIVAKESGLGSEVDEGGRWERIIDEDDWKEVELLEDLEDDGQVDRLSDDESVQRVRSFTSEPPTVPEKEVAVAPTPAASDISPQALLQEDLNSFSSMLDSLAIVERPPGQSSNREEEVTPNTEEAQKPARSRRIRLVDKQTNGDREVNNEDEQEKAEVSDVDSDDMDVLGELNLRRGGDNEDDVVSTILRAGRHLESVQDSTDGGEEELSEEQLKELKEEDDLFELAWQARDEERAKGNWTE